MSDKPHVRPIPPGRGYTVRVLSESRAEPTPDVALPLAYPVNLPFEAYKHLLSGRPLFRPRPYQRPTGDAGTGA